MTDSPWPIAFRVLTAAVLVTAMILLASCQTRPREIVVPRIEERRIEIPASLLECLPQPVARQRWVTQRDVARFLVLVAEAGEDCRAKLDAVRRLIESQG